MKCTNCGAELQEDSVFCVNCGTKVEAAQSQVNEQKTAQPETQPETQSSVQLEIQPETQNPVQPEMQQVQQPVSQPVPQSGKKNHGLLVAGIGVVLLAIVAAVVLVVIRLLGSAGGNGNEKLLVYQKDGTLYYMPNMDKEKEPIEIDECRDDERFELCLSESGRYLYYCSGDSRRTLSRAELGKLKSDTGKNTKYIVEIDSKVSDFTLIDDTRLIYRDTSDRLYYFDGKQEEEIDKNVYDYRLAAGSMIYYESEKGDQIRYCYYDLSKKQGDCFAKDINVVDADWSKGIVYAMDKDEIYQIDRNGNEEKLVDEVDQLVNAFAEDGKIYFAKARTEKHKLYEYVDDTDAEEDAKVEEPRLKDYLTKCKEKDAMYEGDYQYYKEYPEEKHYFYENLDWNSELEMSYYYNWATDREFYYDADQKQWYELDGDAFYNANMAFEQIAYRNNLRSELKDAVISQTYYDLYVWEQDKDSRLLVENIDLDHVLISEDADLVVYSKSQDEDGQKIRIPMDSVSCAEDVGYRIGEYAEEMEDDPKGICYAMIGTNAQELEGYVDRVTVAPDGKTAIIWERQDGEVAAYSYEITSSGLDEIGRIGDDVVNGTWIGDSFYFTSGEDGYGNFMVYKNGKEKILAKNIYLNSVNFYDDGLVSAYKDEEARDLRIFNDKGEDKKITSDVYRYSYINENRIVYIKNENLYVYTGKDEDRRVVRNIGEYYDSYVCIHKSSQF